MAFNVVEIRKAGNKIISEFDGLCTVTELQMDCAIIKSDLSTFKVYFESDKSGNKLFVNVRGCFAIIEQDIELHIPNVTDFLLESFEYAIKKELSK